MTGHHIVDLLFFLVSIPKYLFIILYTQLLYAITTPVETILVVAPTYRHSIVPRTGLLTPANLDSGIWRIDRIRDNPEYMYLIPSTYQNQNRRKSVAKPPIWWDDMGSPR